MISVFDHPVYEISEAAHFLHLRADRVRRWLLGYECRWGEPRKTSRKSPVVQRRAGEDSRAVSFLDLMELLYGKAFLERGFSLQKVRLALDEAKQYLKDDHPFARRRFFTWGENIYLEFPTRGGLAIVDLLQKGQLAIRPIILHVAEQIEFDRETGLASAWWPLGRTRPVTLNPKVSFGLPTVTGRGIRTANVYDLYLAENGDTSTVCGWFELSQEEVRAAVEFEESLRRSA